MAARSGLTVFLRNLRTVNRIKNEPDNDSFDSEDSPGLEMIRAEQKIVDPRGPERIGLIERTTSTALNRSHYPSVTLVEHFPGRPAAAHASHSYGPNR